MKKFFALLLAVLMVISVTACTSAPAEQASATETATEQAAPAEATTEEAAPTRESATSAPAAEFEGPTETVSIPKTMKVAFVGENIANTSSYVGSVTFKSICEKLGYECQVFDGAGTVEQQNQCILDAISWGAEGIIVSSCDESSVQQGILAAYDKDIPIIGIISNGTDDPNPRKVLPEGQKLYLCDVGARLLYPWLYDGAEDQR
jgi:simple sugar transport system substrate-binding protein